ncbi:galactosyltransferase-related protein [Citromicrobium bathyomarinum]|uniref:glycosyltransferase family 2 protein n=1 Tax=Citromicrobium bathyomarinum TaxID=72174 RepID=UPI003159DB86
MSISVCTLAFGREEHLANLVRGLCASTRLPDELVIAVMQSAPFRLPDAPFPVRQIMLGADGIPLAAGRNRAAAEARGDLLVFLDVDCIPASRCVEDYARHAESLGGLLMGEVAYLPDGAAMPGIDEARFEQVGVKHSERAGAPKGTHALCSDYRCFWSLNFAMTKESFTRTGGFDERFVGYGGEDTDFGRTVATHELPIWWVLGAKAFHQYHPHHMPPVHHLDSVLANARRFAAKWGEPTMQHWLRAFVLMGLVERAGDGWRKLREPDESDLELTRQQESAPYASSATVLDWLEARAASPDADGGPEATPAPAIASA